MRRFSTILAVLSLLIATAPFIGIAGPDDPPSEAPADNPVTVDGRTDDAAYTTLGTSPAAPGDDFTGGVLTLKTHRGTDSLYVAVEGKLRAGEGDDTFREMLVFFNADGTEGVEQGMSLPAGDDNLSPFGATGGMQMDRETDYGVRLTGGNDPQAFASVIDYAGFAAGDSTESGQALDSFEGTVPSLDGTPVTGGAFGGRYAYRDAPDLSSVEDTGFEFAIPYDSLAAGPDDAVQFFAVYGDVEGDNISATLIPDDESDATYGNSQDWTAVSGTQYTDFLGTVEDPFVAANILSPAGNPPLFPFMTSTDTTVTVSVSVDTARVDQINELRLLVDDTEVASTTSDSLAHDLTMDTPNRFALRAELEVTANNVTFGDTTRTFVIRTPDVVDEARPPGIEDGINYNDDGSVTLSLFAPNKDFVYTIGDFTNWEIDPDFFMKRDVTDNGAHWWVTLDSLSNDREYDYQYFVDGELRLADPFARKVRGPGDSGISEDIFPDLEPYPGDKTVDFVSVLQPNQDDFTFSEFTPPDHDELVIYELLVRDFVEQNSYATLTDTLDYLDRLGVNAIELMPVSEFGSNSSWGYNPSFHFALDKAYGPQETLKQFVEEAHSRGIAVILDVVYNHITGQSPLVKLYGNDNSQNRFLESSQDCGPFNELNQDSPFIRNYIDRANTYWLEEFNVDGFRYDLASCLDPPSSNPVAGVKDIADHVWDTVDPDTYMIMEFFGSFQQEQEIANYRVGEPEIDGMMPWHKLNPEYNESSMGFVEPGGIFSSNIEPTYFGFETDGQGNNFDRPNLISYMQSHDEQWLMHKNREFGRVSEDGTYAVPELETALNRQKLVGAFFFTVPGPRMMWQFGELGYGYAKDECLREDDGSDSCGPQVVGRTGEKPIRWEYRDPDQSPDRVRLYKTWQALLRLRNQHPVFTNIPSLNNDEEGINMQAEEGDIVRTITLENPDMDALIVGNFGVTRRTAQVTFPQTGTWYNVFEDKTREVGAADQSFPLRPGEFRVYTSNPVSPPPMGLVPSAPIVRSTVSVNSDGTEDFAETGVDVAFSGVSGSGDVTAEKLSEDPLGTDGISESTVSAFRFVLTAGGDLGFDGSTELRLDVATLSGVNDASNVTVYRRPTEDTGSFTALSTTYDSGANELVAPIEDDDTLGEFVLASNSEPLPVEMAGFDVATQDDAVRLRWQTASETNNAGFRVQRRPAGETTGRGTDAEWQTVGRVDGAGTTTEAQSYRFVDEELPFEADRLAYRLAQVDTDGSVTHSQTLTVERRVREVTLRGTFPNPARHQVTVQYALPEARPVTLRLYDVLGRRVQTVAQAEQEGRREVQLDVSGLTSGVYFLRLTAGETTQTERLTVVR